MKKTFLSVFPASIPVLFFLCSILAAVILANPALAAVPAIVGQDEGGYESSPVTFEPGLIDEMSVGHKVRVNVTNGNLVVSRQDLVIPTRGRDIVIERIYNSRERREGVESGLDVSWEAGSTSAHVTPGICWIQGERVVLGEDVYIHEENQMVRPPDVYVRNAEGVAVVVTAPTSEERPRLLLLAEGAGADGDYYYKQAGASFTSGRLFGAKLEERSVQGDANPFLYQLDDGAVQIKDRAYRVLHAPELAYTEWPVYFLLVPDANGVTASLQTSPIPPRDEDYPNGFLVISRDTTIARGGLREMGRTYSPAYPFTPQLGTLGRWRFNFESYATGGFEDNHAWDWLGSGYRLTVRKGDGSTLTARGDVAIGGDTTLSTTDKEYFWIRRKSSATGPFSIPASTISMVDSPGDARRNAYPAHNWFSLKGLDEEEWVFRGVVLRAGSDPTQAQNSAPMRDDAVLTEIRDRNGNRLVYEWQDDTARGAYFAGIDGTGAPRGYRLARIYDESLNDGDELPDSVVLSFSYNAQGFVSSITLSGPNGENPQVVEEYYYEGGNLSGFRDAHGRVFSYTYGGDGRLIGIGDEKGGLSSFSYYPNSLKASRIRSPRFSGGVAQEFNGDDGLPGQTAVLLGGSGNLNADYSYSWTGKWTEEKIYQESALADGAVNRYGWEYTEEWRYTGPDKPQALVFVNRRITSKDVYPASGYDAAAHQPVAGVTPVFAQSWTFNPVSAQPVSETDELGHSTFFTYDPWRLLTKKAFLVSSGPDYEETTYNANHDSATWRDRNGNVRSFEYADARNPHLKTRESFRVGGYLQSRSFAYDAYGLVQTAVDARNHSTHYAYNPQGLMTSKTFIIQEWNQATGSSSPVTVSEVWEYHDLFGRPSRRVDAVGHQVTYEYDPVSRYRIWKSEQVAGRGTAFEYYGYDELGNLDSITDYQGMCTRYTYDADGNITVVQKESVAGTFVTDAIFEYESGGGLVAKVDALNHRREIARNAAGWVASVTEKAVTTGTVVQDLVTTFSHDATGKVVGKILPGGESVWAYSYDDLGRLIGVTEPGATVSASYSWDNNGNLLSFTDPGGRGAQFRYNEQNLVSDVIQSGRTMVHTLYDGEGAAEWSWEDGFLPPPWITVFSAGGTTSSSAECMVGSYKQSTFVYSNRDMARKVVPTAPITFDKVRVYIAARTGSPTGNWTVSCVTDAGGLPSATRLKRYDGTDAVVTAAGPATTGWVEFDLGAGRTITTGSAFWVVFDAVDQPALSVRYWTLGYAGTSSGVSARKSTGGSWTSATYNVGLELRGPPVPPPEATHTLFNPEGTVKEVVVGDGQTLKYGYEKRGLPLFASRRVAQAGTVATTMEYDENARLTKKSQLVAGDTLALLFAYDKLGRATTVTYPVSAEGLPFAVNYRYTDDAYHRLSSVPGYLDAVSYDLNGRVTGITFANGVNETVERDELGRPREQTIVDTSDPAGSVNRFLESYLWSERGNLTQKATERLDAGGNSIGVTLEALSYDLNDRLTVADAGTDGVERFSYDGAGNRLNDPSVSPVDSTFNGYDSCNRLIRQGPANAPHVALSYIDPSGRSRGNIVSRTLVDGAGLPLAVQATYSWTQDNLLTGVARPGFSAVSYRYDAEGARVSRYAGGLTTKYLFMGLEPLLERRSDGSADYYVHALGRQVGRVTTNGLGGQETVFFHADYLKSVRAVTDVTGAVVWSERYKAFGSPAELAGGTANPYRFTGKCWDEEAGLFYFQARWLDPAIGRFLSEDPLWGNIRDPQSLNRFAYGRNNPHKYKDPTGKFYFAAVLENPYALQAMEQLGAWGRAGIAMISGLVAAVFIDQSIETLSSQASANPMEMSNPNLTGPPGTSVTQWGGKEAPVPVQTTTYGPNGNRATDIDHDHDHGQGKPHAHDWDIPDEKDQRDSDTNNCRGPGRALTDKEKELVDEIVNGGPEDTGSGEEDGGVGDPGEGGELP